MDKPEDLRGKRVGVPEYSITAAVWIRGFLSDDYGIKASDVEWFTGGQEVPGRKERIELRLPPEIKVQPIAGDRTLNAIAGQGRDRRPRHRPLSPRATPPGRRTSAACSPTSRR